MICYNDFAQGITFFLHLRYGISDVLTGVEDRWIHSIDDIGILNVRQKTHLHKQQAKISFLGLAGFFRSFFLPF